MFWITETPYVNDLGRRRDSAQWAVFLKATVNDDAATVQWACTAGALDSTSGRQVVWTAPGTAGTYTISAVASVGDQAITASTDITVKKTPVYVIASHLEEDILGGKEAHITIRNESSKTVGAFRDKIVM